MPGHKRKSSPLLIDAEDRIAADVLCIKCGDNLRGLHVADRCPNCNHPASDSVHGDYLIHADRPVVRGLAEAAQVVEYGAIVLGSLMVIALLVSLASADDLEDAIKTAYNTLFAGAIISPVVAVLGLVLLTTRHSAAYYWVRYGNPRALLRLGLLLAVVLAIIAVAAHYFGRVALEIGIVLWFVMPLAAFFRGLERLMRRVPNNQLATFARATFVGLLAFGVLSILVILTNHWSAEDPSWRDSQLAFSAITCVGGLALGIAACLLMVRVRRTLDSIAR
jgi:hypothetical protein